MYLSGCACVHEWVCITTVLMRRSDYASENWVLPSIKWVQGIELRLAALAASVYPLSHLTGQKEELTTSF